jgi:PKD repeat protein
VDANSAGPRTGTIGIEGLTFTVNQAPPPPVAAFTVSPTSAVAGEFLSFTDTSTGAPTSWSWDFGDGSGAAAQNVSHAYPAAGTYTVVLTVANQTAQNSMTQQITVASGFARWVPVVSHVSGANAAEWRSDVSVLNPGTVAATVQGQFHASGGVVPGTVAIPAGSQFVLQDVVGALGSIGAGALEILSDLPVVVASRTYDQLADGTVGQDYASYAVTDGLVAGQWVWLPQLSQNAAYRSNISLTNIGNAPADVTVALFDGSGNQLATYGVTLAPGDWAQQNRPFYGYADQTSLDTGYAKVTVNSGAGIIATAAVIDNITNDPTTVPMTRASDVPSAGSVWIPSVSHVQGTNGTEWRSDLGLLNPGPTPANVQGFLYTSGGVLTGAAAVPAGSQLVLTDVVSQFGYYGSGALQIVSDQPLVATSRTYDQLASGTVGQEYGSYTTAGGLGAGQSAWLPQLAENAAYRTNISLTNTGGTTAAVTVTLFDGGGNALASYDVTLAPGEWSQENQPFVFKALQSNLDGAYAEVTVTSGAGVVASASVIDNVTNDPTTIAMIPQ